jgi:hypothetical protein
VNTVIGPRGERCHPPQGGGPSSPAATGRVGDMKKLLILVLFVALGTVAARKLKDV